MEFARVGRAVQRVTCAARRYEWATTEWATTDVDAAASTQAACERAIEACENDADWNTGEG